MKKLSNKIPTGWKNIRAKYVCPSKACGEIIRIVIGEKIPYNDLIKVFPKNEYFLDKYSQGWVITHQKHVPKPISIVFFPGAMSECEYAFLPVDKNDVKVTGDVVSYLWNNIYQNLFTTNPGSDHIVDFNLDKFLKLPLFVDVVDECKNFPTIKLILRDSRRQAASMKAGKMLSEDETDRVSEDDLMEWFPEGFPKLIDAKFGR